MSDKKYFSYIRVSTQRQGQHGTSLAEQQASIERFATNWKLPIIKRFEERETAAKQGRPVFLDMLKQLRQGKAQGVVIHKIDRSARNLKDWADLGSLIDSGLEIHFASESLDLSSRGGRLSADIQAVVASDYIRNLREETKKGMYGRLKQGLFPFRAPIGYLDCGKGQPKRVDPVTGPLVRKAFELYSTGRWSLKTLPNELFRIGLRNRTGSKVSVNGLATILHNLFYMGIIRIEKTGQVFVGVHRPLISKSLFDKVREVFDGKNIPKDTVHNFTFRRLIRCGKCKNFLIGEMQKRRVYYRCHTDACTSACLREDTLTFSIMGKLEKLQLGPDEFRLYRDMSIEMFGKWRDESDQTLNELMVRQKRLKERHSRLIDSYLDRVIDKEAYFERKVQLLSEEQDLKAKVDGFADNWAESPSKFEEFLELASSAYLSFKSAPAEMKREMLEMVTSNFVANGKSVSIKLENPFALLSARPAFTIGSPSRVVARTVTPFLSQLLKIFQEFLSDKHWSVPANFEPIYIPPSVRKKLGTKSEKKKRKARASAPTMAWPDTGEVGPKRPDR